MSIDRFMKKNITLTIVSLITFCISSYSQVNQDISISEIRTQIENLFVSIKSEAKIDKMYLVNEDNGERWIYIENIQIVGLPSDVEYESLELSKLVIKILYKSINFNLEESISINSFKDILKSKRIIGVKFKTKNKIFFIPWEKLGNS